MNEQPGTSVCSIRTPTCPRLLMRALVQTDRVGARSPPFKNVSRSSLWKRPSPLFGFCISARVWWSASHCRGCQSFMKSVPVSGFLWESGSSGVKDVGRWVWVYYTGRHSYVFSLVSSCPQLWTAHWDLCPLLFSAWGPYRQDNFGMSSTHSRWI